MRCDCGRELLDVHAVLDHECAFTRAEQDWWSKYFKAITNVPVSEPPKPNELFRR